MSVASVGENADEGGSLSGTEREAGSRGPVEDVLDTDEARTKNRRIELKLTER